MRQAEEGGDVALRIAAAELELAGRDLVHAPRDVGVDQAQAHLLRGGRGRRASRAGRGASSARSRRRAARALRRRGAPRARGEHPGRLPVRPRLRCAPWPRPAHPSSKGRGPGRAGIPRSAGVSPAGSAGFQPARRARPGRRDAGRPSRRDAGAPSRGGSLKAGTAGDSRACGTRCARRTRGPRGGAPRTSGRCRSGSRPRPGPSSDRRPRRCPGADPRSP